MLRRGSVDELKAYALEILRAGGPHGGPDLYESNFRKMPVLSFQRQRAEDGARIGHFGRGYEARVFPVEGEDSGAVIVSPGGSFVIVGFGLLLDLGLHADWHGRNFHDEEDIILGYRPFHVRIAGVVHRLTHTPIHGLLGSVKSSLGELFLFVVGVNDLALVLEDADSKELTVIERGDARKLCGLELLPDEVPVPLIAPEKFSCEEVAAAIGRASSLAPVVRDGLCRQIADARKTTGTETVRRFTWALVIAHHEGQRSRIVGDTAEIFEWFVARGYLPALPGDRVRREALRWLREKTGLASRPRDRSPTWSIHFECLSTPNEEIVARLAL